MSPLRLRWNEFPRVPQLYIADLRFKPRFDQKPALVLAAGIMQWLRGGHVILSVAGWSDNTGREESARVFQAKGTACAKPRVVGGWEAGQSRWRGRRTRLDWTWGKGFGFYPAGNGEPGEQQPGQICILKRSPGAMWMLSHPTDLRPSRWVIQSTLKIGVGGCWTEIAMASLLADGT